MIMLGIPVTNFCLLPVSKKDQNYEATRLHFENLVKRYGNPIIILNLIKVISLVTVLMLLIMSILLVFLSLLLFLLYYAQ